MSNAARRDARPGNYVTHHASRGLVLEHQTQPLPPRLKLLHEGHERRLPPDAVEEGIAREKRVVRHSPICRPAEPLDGGGGLSAQGAYASDVVGGVMKRARPLRQLDCPP